MNISRAVETYLNACMDSSSTTQEAVSKKLNISRSYLNKIIFGKAKTTGMTLEVLDRMFPNAIINLTGSAHATHCSVTVVNNGNDNNVITHAAAASEFEQKILDADELSAEEKIKVLKVLKK